MRMNERELVSGRDCSENEPPSSTHHEETDRKRSIFTYYEATNTSTLKLTTIPEANDAISPHRPTMKTSILSSSQRQCAAALDETMSTLSTTTKIQAASANNESGRSSNTTTTNTDNRRHNRNHDKEKKAISFGTVSTFFFTTILGDSPAVRDGCPIALGNKCVSKQTLDLRTHEMMALAEQQQRCNEKLCQPKQQQNRHNQYIGGDGVVPYCPTRLRRGKELYIPVLERSKLLLDHGYSIHDIVETVMAVEDAKKLRAESLKVYKWQSKVKDVIGFAAGGRKNSFLRKVLTVNNNSSTSSQKKNRHGKVTSSSSAAAKPHSVQARTA